MSYVVRAFPPSAANTDETITIPSIAGSSITTVTNGTTTLTSAALFGSVFPGMSVSGTGIPQGTLVASIASESSLTLSNAATDSTSTARTFSHNRPYWQLLSAKFLFTTDANAANRFTKIVIDDGTNVIWSTPNEVAQSASLAVLWCFAPGASMPASPSATATTRTYAIPDLVLGPGWRISTQTSSKQVGDIWSAAVFVVDEKTWA